MPCPSNRFLAIQLTRFEIVFFTCTGEHDKRQQKSEGKKQSMWMNLKTVTCSDVLIFKTSSLKLSEVSPYPALEM